MYNSRSSQNARSRGWFNWFSSTTPELATVEFGNECLRLQGVFRSILDKTNVLGSATPDEIEVALDYWESLTDLFVLDDGFTIPPRAYRDASGVLKYRNYTNLEEYFDRDEGTLTLDLQNPQANGINESVYVSSLGSNVSFFFHLINQFQTQKSFGNRLINFLSTIQ